MPSSPFASASSEMEETTAVVRQSDCSLRGMSAHMSGMVTTLVKKRPGYLRASLILQVSAAIKGSFTNYILSYYKRCLIREALLPNQNSEKFCPFPWQTFGKLIKNGLLKSRRNLATCKKVNGSLAIYIHQAFLSYHPIYSRYITFSNTPLSFSFMSQGQITPTHLSSHFFGPGVFLRDVLFLFWKRQAAVLVSQEDTGLGPTAVHCAQSYQVS